MDQSMSAAGPKPVRVPTSKRNSAFHGLRREETIAGYLLPISYWPGRVFVNDKLTRLMG